MKRRMCSWLMFALLMAIARGPLDGGFFGITAAKAAGLPEPYGTIAVGSKVEVSMRDDLTNSYNALGIMGPTSFPVGRAFRIYIAKLYDKYPSTALDGVISQEELNTLVYENYDPSALAVTVAPNKKYCDITILKDTMAILKIVQPNCSGFAIIMVKPNPSNDILLNKPVIQTSGNVGGNNLTHVNNLSYIDETGNAGNWQPVPTEAALTPQWLAFDLQNTFSVDRVVIKWRTRAGGTQHLPAPTPGFKIEVCNDSVGQWPTPAYYQESYTGTQAVRVTPGGTIVQYLDKNIMDAMNNWKWTTFYDGSGNKGNLFNAATYLGTPETFSNKYLTTEITYDQIQSALQKKGVGNVGRYIRIYFPPVTTYSNYTICYAINEVAVYGRQQTASTDSIAFSGNTLQLKVSNNQSSPLTGKKVIAAVFNGDVMEAIQSQDLSMNSLEKNKDFSFTLSGALTNRDIKVFLWDATEDMQILDMLSPIGQIRFGSP